MTAWTKIEILKLISIWGEDEIQAQLESCRRNQDVYQKIADELSEAGFTRTYQQCREKLKKLKSEYRKVRDKRNTTGQGRYPEWDYFDPMNQVLGNRPATEPNVIIDASASKKTLSGPEAGSFAAGTTVIPAGNNEEDVHDEELETQLSEMNTPVQLEQKKRKVKRSRAESMASEIVDKLVSMQAKTDEMMLGFEEKRLKAEEKIREEERKNRQEEREFQLRLIQMMTGPSPAAYSYLPQYQQDPEY